MTFVTRFVKVVDTVKNATVAPTFPKFYQVLPSERPELCNPFRARQQRKILVVK